MSYFSFSAAEVIICKCSVMLMFKKAAAFAHGSMFAWCIAATRWPWVRLPGKHNPHLHPTSSPTQRTRKHVILLGRSNFLAADIITSDEQTPRITCSFHSYFTFTMGAFLTTVAVILFWLFLQQIDKKQNSLCRIYSKIFLSSKVLWYAGGCTNMAVHA